MASPSSQSSLQRAREYTPEEWEAIRETFTQLYQSPQAPKLTLSNIQVIMSEKYGFDATLRQYKRKVKLWNLERNIKLDDSKFMVQKELQRKQQEGKKTKFTVNGREVTEAKFARIRRKLFKSTSPAKPYSYTPMNIRYFTPRDQAGNSTSPTHQRRPSQSHAINFSTHHTHLVECFLCPVNNTIYGKEATIMQSFQDHVRAAHSGYDVLRRLNGYDASSIPGAVRTQHQLPSNQVGYVHGIRTDNLDPVRLGRLCHVEDQSNSSNGRHPYLTLTHATSCLTLRGDTRSGGDFDNSIIPPPTPVSSFDLSSTSLDFGQMTAEDWSTAPYALSNGTFDDEFDEHFGLDDQFGTMNQDIYTGFDDWNAFEEDDFKEQGQGPGIGSASAPAHQEYWRSNGLY